jgi:putative cell wall-binding protein
MTRARRTSVVGLCLLLAVALAIPSQASDPASNEATVPTAAGGEVVVTWTGSALPGVSDGDCAAATGDSHEVDVTVPAAAEQLQLAARVDITYDGPATDLKFLVVPPEGEPISVDNGFVDEDESVSFGGVTSGTYTIIVCAFASVVPQAYAGAMTFTASERTSPISEGPTCLAPAEQLEFEMEYIDTTRAGGEPIVETMPDGTLLWGSHAGTTHFFGPAAPDPDTAAFIENYQGQTYQYFSEDDGVTWEFVERTPIQGANLPGQGFSDPVFAQDQAGNVFISEINLANVAVSKSTDGGRSYELQNLLSFVNSDRQWMAADEEDVLYMTANAVGSGGAFPLPPTFSGHFLAKSVDGGQSFIAAEQPNPDGVADIQVDFSDGTLYEISASPEGELGMAVFRDIRGRDSDFADGMTITPIASGAGYTGINRLIDPTFDMDSEGNLYIVWTENGTGAAGRPPGIYYSYSTDRGETFHQPPIRVDTDERTDIWPWITVGAPGQVAISYLQIEAELPNNDAEQAPEDLGWNVITSHTSSGLGCGDSELPGFQHTTSTSEPIHFGTICQGGTVCQAMAVDRRLGDYFANEIDGNGNLYISVSDTRQGGAVALPLVVRQVGGPSFLDPPGGAVGACGTTSEVAEGPTFARLDAAGAGLAVQLATACFETADTVVLARDDVFADALAGGGLAGALDAPVLLTGREGLDDAVGEELERLGVERAVLLGGAEALDPQVEADLAALGIETDRIGGPDRFTTAELVAREIGDVSGTAIVALGARPDAQDPWPDALASGVLSAHRRIPTLLATPGEVPQVTLDALADLVDEGGEVLVVGGEDAIGAAAERQLVDAGYTVRRLAGGDRYETAVRIVEEALIQGASPSLVVLASGESFQSPLAAGPTSVQAGGITLLVPPDRLPEPVADLLRERADQVQAVVVAGDRATIGDTVVDEVRAVLAEDAAGEVG